MIEADLKALSEAECKLSETKRNTISCKFVVHFRIKDNAVSFCQELTRLMTRMEVDMKKKRIE